MNFRIFFITVTLATTVALPITVHLFFTGKISGSLGTQKFASVKNLIKPIKAQKKDVAQILKTKRCVGCDLSNIDLSGADLSGADFRNADLSGANLTKVSLKEAKLSGARLNGANLTRADVDGADLRGSDLKERISVTLNF